jgi:hypothetical protein
MATAGGRIRRKLRADMKPLFNLSPSKKPRAKKAAVAQAATIPVDWDRREWLACPVEMKYLKAHATQPGNIRSRKPARLIYLYTMGLPRTEIIADLKVDESTLDRWFTRWIESGVAGVTGLVYEELAHVYE